MKWNWQQHSFFATVYKPFFSYEGTEWGDTLHALCNAYGMLGSGNIIEKGPLYDIIEEKLRSELEIAWQTEDLYGGENSSTGLYPYYQQEFDYAKSELAKTFADFKHMYPDGDIQTAYNNLPDWMK
jgi:hypothetical protein